MIKNFLQQIIDYANDFAETTNNGDDFIMVDVHTNTSAVESGCKNKNWLIIALHSVSNGYIQTSLIQHKYTY